jgi:hypothetical protein
MKTPRCSPIGRQLQAYEEGWKADHDEAMQFWAFQESLSVGIAIFNVITRRDATWRGRVSRGIEPFSSEENEEVLGLFQWWLRCCDMAMKRLEHFEHLFGSVEGATKLRECCGTAQERVANWVPPALSKAPGLQAAEFDEVEAKKLSMILKSGKARLPGQPRPIE